MKEFEKSLAQAAESMYYVDWLIHNLLSISQVCDKENEVRFISTLCIIMNKLISKDLVRNLPKVKFLDGKVYNACTKGKKVMSFLKQKKLVLDQVPIGEDSL